MPSFCILELERLASLEFLGLPPGDGLASRCFFAISPPAAQAQCMQYAAARDAAGGGRAPERARHSASQHDRTHHIAATVSLLLHRPR